jgi:hypothetical protein
VKPRRQLLSALLLGAMTLFLVGCNSESPTSVIPEDLSPPQAPANVHARFDVPTGRDWLAWDPSSSPNVSAYEVHYSDSPSGIDHTLGNVDSGSNEYALPLVAENTTQYYRLRAIGNNGVPSAFTPPIQVQRSGWDGGQDPNDPKPGTAGDD